MVRRKPRVREGSGGDGVGVAERDGGWLKDRYGLSWQVVPSRMDEMLRSGTPEQVSRVTEAFLAMKKFDLAELERAHAGAAATRGGRA